MSFQKTICVDFDGTVVDHAFPAIGKLKPGVREALRSFRQMGYKVLVYSCRTCKWFPDEFLAPGETLDMNRQCVREMIEFLDENQIPYDEIDDGTKGKPLAEYYIDDKAIRFNNNWDFIKSFIEVNTYIQEAEEIKREARQCQTSSKQLVTR